MSYSAHVSIKRGKHSVVEVSWENTAGVLKAALVDVDGLVVRLIAHAAGALTARSSVASFRWLKDG